MSTPEIAIREVETYEEMKNCVAIQRRAFSVPDLEISPARHLLVTRCAGGWTLGAYHGDRLVGFVLSVAMFHGNERALYSHMTGVDPEYQNHGIGAKLKWAQRAKALSEGIRYIKWTFQPVLARNAFFNLERLGATVSTYQPDFYGAEGEPITGREGATLGNSDRLFADWHLESPKVVALSKGEAYVETAEARREITVPFDWHRLTSADPAGAIREQERMRREFLEAFGAGLVARGFVRSETDPRYLLY